MAVNSHFVFGISFSTPRQKKEFASINGLKQPYNGFLATVQQLNRSPPPPLLAFIYVDAAIDHAHKEMMSQGFSVSRWAETLIRKSIVLSIGSAVFGKGWQSEATLRPKWEATFFLQSHSNFTIC